MPAAPTVTKSRTLDRAIFALLFALLLASAPRLRVYYESTQVGATVVEVAAVTAQGRRIQLAAPAELLGHRLREAEAKAREHAASPGRSAMTPPGGHIEWTLRYVLDSTGTTVNRTRVLTTRQR